VALARWPDAVADASTADHVTALLIVGIGIEYIVGGVFQNLLQALVRHRCPADLRIRNRGGVVDVLNPD
jgi:hypothetical protein